MVNPLAMIAYTSNLALGGTEALESLVDRTLTAIEGIVLPYANPYTGAALLAAVGVYTVYRRYRITPQIQPQIEHPKVPESEQAADKSSREPHNLRPRPKKTP